jgi:phosphohistidine swiveling domain-containing protein
MTQWLLSGHNPRETFGIPYPISGDYFTEFMGRRQYEYLLDSLAGGTEEFDLSSPGMLVVEGYLYVNITSFMRNLGLVLPVDPTSLGAPRSLVTSDTKPRLATRLLLPFRLWNIYRETVGTYRVVVPRYREILDEIYWGLRASDPDHPSDQDLALIERLFEPSTINDAIAFLNAYNIVTVINIAVSELVNQRAPALLNLLVGHGTSTAQLGERMWKLRQVAVQCGAETVKLLHQGETDLARYRAVGEAAPLLETVDRFMRTYGHRAFHYASEFEATRLADQPQLVLLTTAALLKEDEPPAVRAEAARQMGYQALQEMNPISQIFWQQLLKLGSVLVERREDNRSTLELQNATYGLAAKLLSRHYFPDQPSDYLWLYTFEELVAFGQNHGQQRVDPEEIERRRADLERYQRQPVPPELIWYDPETKEWWPVQEVEAEELSPTAEVRLQGIGASAGSGPVEGTAVVTNSAEEAAERLLEISGPVVLVTHVTDPVWSSLFRRLTAVVTEMGGAVSHAALVARENGIPAVVGVAQATRWIRDGERVRVDGAAGTVEVIQ